MEQLPCESCFVCADAEESAARAEVTELSRKAAVLSGHTARCQDSLHVLREFTRRIRQRRELFR